MTLRLQTSTPHTCFPLQPCIFVRHIVFMAPTMQVPFSDTIVQRLQRFGLYGR